MLSCDITEPDDISEPGVWFYETPDDFTVFDRIRRIRCLNCQELIDHGSSCVLIPRFRYPQYEVEVSIYGEDGQIPLANWYLCEECGGLALNLWALGFFFDFEKPGYVDEAMSDYRLLAQEK